MCQDGSSASPPPPEPKEYWETVNEAVASLGDDAEKFGLGDMTASALEAVGITKGRFAAWRGEIGPCQGCVDRQEFMNKLGRKIVEFLRPTAP